MPAASSTASLVKRSFVGRRISVSELTQILLSFLANISQTISTARQNRTDIIKFSIIINFESSYCRKNPACQGFLHIFFRRMQNGETVIGNLSVIAKIIWININIFIDI